jgi:hypothetical protein
MGPTIVMYSIPTGADITMTAENRLEEDIAILISDAD